MPYLPETSGTVAQTLVSGTKGHDRGGERAGYAPSTKSRHQKGTRASEICLVPFLGGRDFVREHRHAKIVNNFS